jgi:hypothetical protein
MPIESAKSKRKQAIVAFILMTLLIAVVSKGASKKRSSGS